MKLIQSIVLSVLSLVILSSSCKKHVIQPVDQLSLLPPATQTGANTFGCLVNGQAFVPQNRSIIEGPYLESSYIYTNGGFHLTVSAGNKNSDGSVTGVAVATDSLAITQGQTLMFRTFAPGNADGSYDINYAQGGSKRLYHKSRSASFFMTEFGSIFWGDIFCVLFGIMV